ncbi:MAG TPA: YggS family pyridoxal phosphate-dependent enzyme [Vulgatibacter sp.]|nr:YggS family pyridoxal phosphate-dependent enzyme [Vulgatibacter sp.]
MASNEEDRALIAARIAAVRERMAAACARVGRSPDEVRLLLATKTVPVERIRFAVEAGATLLGENRVQEALGKYRGVPEAEWHFIGHLQTNKVRQVLEFAKVIHSVDRPSLVEALDARLQRQGREVDVLLQVNTSYEASKFGVSPEGALELARLAARRETLRVRGLMTIGPLSDDLERVRRAYRLLRQLRDELQPEIGELPILSMGMSGDFELAIEEGATLVRVGTSVFGPRGTLDSEYWPEGGPTPA